MYQSIQPTRITSSRRASQVAPRKKLHSLIAAFQPVAPILAGRITFPLLILTAGLLLLQPCAGQGGTWTMTGSLITARLSHTATLLPNGKVLVAGGSDSDFFNVGSAELYDPATGIWTATGFGGGSVHPATLLPNGKVLVEGGYDRDNGFAFTSAFLYDPATGTWTATGLLATGRFNHTATLLPNGTVLVAGGLDSDFFLLASAELYDPTSGNWTTTGSMGTARFRHTATLLPNGKVLVAGGFDLTSAELYDPATGTWTPTGSLATGRDFHTATLLPNGKVLVVAGYNGGLLASAELYDPTSGNWTTTGSLALAREQHTATLLSDGTVLVAGGQGASGDLSSAELYDAVTGTWAATGSLATPRDNHTATLLPDGKVLAAGGYNFAMATALSSAELYASNEVGGLTLKSAASIQRGFAIDLPLSGPSGVEDRSAGPNKKFYVALTFSNNITSVGSATTSCGGVSSWSISGPTVTFKLVGVAHGCNESDITITANDVMDDMGNTVTSASVTMGLLLGDVNGDRVVDGTDLMIVRSYRGQHADGINYRSDVSSDGFIGVSDIQLVNQQQGTSLP